MATSTTKHDTDTDPDPAEAAKEAVKSTSPPESAEKFEVDWIVSDGWASTGYRQSEVAGALSAISKKTLTIEETKAAVKAWLKAPVKEA